MMMVMMMLLLLLMMMLLMMMVMMARHDEKPKKEVLCAKQGLPLLLLCQTAANRPLNSPPMTKVDHKQKIRRKIGTLRQTKDEINIPPMLQHQSQPDFGEADNVYKVGSSNGDDCGM